MVNPKLMREMEVRVHDINVRSAAMMVRSTASSLTLATGGAGVVNC